MVMTVALMMIMTVTMFLKVTMTAVCMMFGIKPNKTRPNPPPGTPSKPARTHPRRPQEWERLSAEGKIGQR